MKSKNAVKAAVLEFLEKNPTQTFTSTVLAKTLNLDVASVSHATWRLAKSGTLVRIIGFGPRGGYGYRMNKEVV